jgi:preprotein translocase subunit SecG
MLSLFIGLLSFVLVLVCLLLGLLILIQLPKKEAGGIGQAFGGGATDALFGTGSGNALTKATKYSASAFVILCVMVSWLTAIQSNQRTSRVKAAISGAAAATTTTVPTSTMVPATPVATNLTAPAPVAAPAPASAPTPAPAAPPKNN